MPLNDKLIITLEPYASENRWGGVKGALDYQDEISTLASVIYDGFKFSALINPNISPETRKMFKMFNRAVKAQDAFATFSGLKFEIEEVSKKTSGKKIELEKKLLKGEDKSIPLRFKIIDEYLPYQSALLSYLKAAISLIYANNPEKFSFLPHIHLWGKICITGNDCVEIALDMMNTSSTDSKLNDLVKKTSRFAMLGATVFSTYLEAFALAFISLFTGITMFICEMLKSRLKSAEQRPLLTFDPYLLNRA